MHQKILNWLLNSKIRGSQGEIYSWLNPNNPGYLYEEVAGYYIKLMCYLFDKTKEHDYLNLAEKTANFLISRMAPNGGFSRDRVIYTFDSAIILSGLINLAKSLKSPKYDGNIQKIADFVANSITQEIAAWDGNKNLINKDKWSLSYSCHLIKASIALFEAYSHFNNSVYKYCLEKNAQKLIDSTFRDGHFIINQSKNEVYTHACCYALEGLLFLKSKGYPYGEIINKTARWLATNQNIDGSMFNWYNHKNIARIKVGDATAQAVRIWCLINKGLYKDNILRGLKFLETLVSYEGGLFYSPESKDINSWVNIFTLQALDFSKGKADVNWII